jgi:ectoine hydroxylase-related dioxygenase (phytanoyl-CoA dioxygenase family)
MIPNAAYQGPHIGESSSWLGHLDHEGFAILPVLFADQEISAVIEEFDRASFSRSRAGVRHCLGTQAVRRIAEDFILLAVVQQVLGPDALPFRATLFDKSPKANWLVVWHQDTALPLRQRRDTLGWGPWSVKEGVIYAHAPETALLRVLALRIHLDDSSVENGPLRVLPGTHRLGVLSDDSIEGLTHEIPAAECVAPRGAILAMRPLLVHSSSKAKGQAPRRVLHIEYASSGKFEGELELAAACTLRDRSGTPAVSS